MVDPSLETCDRCGENVEQVWWCFDDPLWLEVNGKEAGSLCIACFDRRAQRAGVWVEWAPLNLRHLTFTRPQKHRWYWRRKRNATQGFWECSGCAAKSDRVEVSADGRPALGPPNLGGKNLEAHSDRGADE